MTINSDVTVVKGLELKIEQLLSGFSLSKALDGKQLVIAGESVTPKEVVKRLTELLSVFKDARVALQTEREKSEAKKGTTPVAKDYFAQVKALLQVALKSQKAELAKFGLRERAPARKLTAEQNAQRVERMRATREARHTLGSRQKAEVKGDVPATPAAGATTNGATPATK